MAFWLLIQANYTHDEIKAYRVWASEMEGLIGSDKWL